MKLAASALALVAGLPLSFGGQPATSTKPTVARAGADVSGEVKPASVSPHFEFSLLPKSFQRRPSLDFNIITEMTPEGRKLTPASPENPVYYLEEPGKFLQMGSAPPANEHAPSVADLEAAMQKALAGGGYLPAALPKHPPALLVVFNFGSNSIDPPIPFEVVGTDHMPPVTADELLPIIVQDANLARDVLDRAALTGGVVFSEGLKKALVAEAENMRFNYESPPAHLPVNPEIGSPYKSFLMSGNSALVTQLVEDAFHSCYFVVASAYDYAAMTRHQRRLLWRTKMTVDASGVNMTETLAPLIASAAPYLGRDMSETTVVTKKISREGHVEIGTPTVVDDNAAGTKPGDAVSASQGKK